MKTKEKYIHIINELDSEDAKPEVSANVSFIDGEPEYDEIEEDGLDEYTRSIVDGTKVALQYLIVASEDLWNTYAKDKKFEPYFSDADGASNAYHKRIIEELNSIFPSLANADYLRQSNFANIKAGVLNDIKDKVGNKLKDDNEYVEFSSGLYDAINSLKNSFNSVVGNPKPYTKLKEFIKSNAKAKEVPNGVDSELESILPEYKEFKNEVRKKKSKGDDEISKSSYKNLYEYLSTDKIGRMFVTLMRLYPINPKQKFPPDLDMSRWDVSSPHLWEFYENYLDQFIQGFSKIEIERKKRTLINEGVRLFQVRLYELIFIHDKVLDKIKQLLSTQGTKDIYEDFAELKQRIPETYNSLLKLLKLDKRFKLIELDFKNEPYINTGLEKIKNQLNDFKKFADFATVFLQVFKYGRTGSVIDKQPRIPRQPVTENYTRKKMVIDLNEIKQNSLNESYIRMYKNWVKELLNYFLSGVNIPVVVKGSKKDVASFAKAFGNEAKYIKAIQKYGLDNDKTYSIKSKLDKAIYGFEKETGLKWPFI